VARYSTRATDRRSAAAPATATAAAELRFSDAGRELTAVNSARRHRSTTRLVGATKRGKGGEGAAAGRGRKTASPKLFITDGHKITLKFAQWANSSLSQVRNKRLLLWLPTRLGNDSIA